MAAAAVVSQRVQDVPRGPSGINPIPGLRKIELMSFEAALQSAARDDADLRAHLADLTHRTGFSRIFADNHHADPPPYPPGSVVPASEPLSREEIIAIHMYTQNSPFYRILNTRLRTEDRTVLVPFLPVLKLLLTALYKLPQLSGPVYRGVKGDLRADFVKNTTKVWWGFSSTSTDLEVLADDAFAGYTGQRTLFYIQACAAFDVRRYSAIPTEHELLLAPGSIVKINGVYSPSPEIHNITMTQEPFVPLPLVEDELSELRALLEQSKGAVAAAQAESASLRDQLQAQQAEIEQLKASGGGSAASAALVAEVERLKQAVASSEKAHQALQAKHASSETDKAVLQAKYASSENDKAARIAENERLKREMASAEKAHQALQRDHEQLKQTAETAKAAQAALQAENERLKQAAKAHKAAQATLQAESKRLKQAAKADTMAQAPVLPSAAAEHAGARRLSDPAKAPNLEALSPIRTISSSFRDSREIREANDTSSSSSPSVLVADWDMGAPALQVWLNNSQLPQQLLATENVSCMLPLTHEHGGDGLLIVSCGQNRVERRGSVVWERTDMKQPYAGVVVEDTVLITENGGAQVTRLDIRTGKTIGAIGKGILKQPFGIDVNRTTGDIVVVDNNWMDTKVLQVFDNKGTPMLTFGKRLLRSPCGVSVDSAGRVYVADSDAKAIVVFDGASGAHLKSIAVEGSPLGVCVTRQGQIVVSVGKRVVVVEE